MHLVVYGLCMSSSWGNGHATLWRGLVKAFAQRGHAVTFYEKNVPYYASTRDEWVPPAGVRLRIYAEFEDILAESKRELDSADVAMFTSYCPDALVAASAILNSDAAIKAFYDLDTPVTLNALQSDTHVSYLPLEGLGGFDLVLSYTGGRALDELKSRLGAKIALPFYGWVDPDTHFPAASVAEFRSELCYLGTFAEDRQAALAELFVNTARALPDSRFAIGGAQYPNDFPWTSNIFFVRHLSPPRHASFFCSARATLNVTRTAMTQYGYCPSGRLFEAAACGVPILTDRWEGLETFFAPGVEILTVSTTADVLNALSLSDVELSQVAAAARERTLQSHTAMQRAMDFEMICENVNRNIPKTVLAS